MSVVDRVNRLVLRRLGRDRAGPTIERDAIRFGAEAVPLTGLSGVLAHEVDVHAGTAITLTLALPGGHSVTVTQTHACWEALLAALDRLELTGAPSRDWTVAVLAGAGAGRPIVLRRDGRPGD